MHKARASFKELIDMLLSDQLSPDQYSLLAEMMDQPEYKAELDETLRDSYYHLADRMPDSPEAAREFLDSIRERMDQPPVSIRRGRVRRYWIAAAAALLLGVAAVYLLRPGKHESSPVVSAHTRDVLPGGNKAILVLADKTTILLDSASSGAVATQGQTSVLKNGHSLVYEPTGSVVPDTSMLFNTVITPTGGQYHLVLSDGTKVWLDSKSSLRFPPAFGSGSREVKMTGQAYFEVADNPSHPFLVHVGDQTVTALGTKFNINAFPEEGAVRTTLAEGSVKVNAEGHELLLRPGQQAIESGQLVEHPDMEETLAWKDGLFRFNSASLPAVTRQLTRWYGVDFIYRDSVRATFVGDVPREVPLSRVLHLLELTRHVRFEIDNKTITIMKY